MKLVDESKTHNRDDKEHATDEQADELKSEVLRQLADLYEKSNPNQRPDLPRDELEPKLNLFKCPFEHRVVPYKNLHPRIRAYIDLIKRMTLDSRVTAASQALYVLGIVSPLSNSWTFFGAGFGLNIGYFAAQAKNDSGNQGKDLALKAVLASGLDPKFIALLGRDLRWSSRVSLLSIPYKLPQKHAKLMSKLLKEIISKRESPFNEIDCDSLVREYHYGVIDNDGNMVLIKDPRDESAKKISKFQMWLKLKQLKQPFQRAMFEIAKPEIRVKQEESQTVPGALPTAV